MARTIKVKLSSKDINNLVFRLDNFSNALDSAISNSIKDLAEMAENSMRNTYNSRPQASTQIDFKTTGSDYSKTISMFGNQAAYEEFGTGTMGEENPHPKKSSFELNEYNSGRTIRPASKRVEEAQGIPEGELYWTYVDENGELHYTQGVSAGKEAYNAAKVVRKQIKPVVEKYLKGALK